MNDDQKQIVLGGLLGNAYLCKGSKNAYLCMRHSVKHLDWLQSKAAELTQYGAATPWHISGTTCTWRSVSHPTFTEFRNSCYVDGEKRVSMEWLNQLRDVAIAIWYGDSGVLMGRKQKNACLRTQSFGLDGNKVIERYFNEVRIPCNVNKSRRSYVIVFTVDGTDRLLRLIAGLLPSNRYDKMLPRPPESPIEIS